VIWIPKKKSRVYLNHARMMVCMPEKILIGLVPMILRMTFELHLSKDMMRLWLASSSFSPQNQVRD
jgi:hypothetical protein